MRTAEVSDHALLGSATKRKKGSHPFPFRRPGAGSTWQWPSPLPPTGTTSFAQMTSSLRKYPASCMATTKREPEETWQIVSRLQDPERILVVLIAATGVRISEALALQWRHVRFEDECIRIDQAFRLSEITTTKTKLSKASVPMCEALAGFLQNW